MVLAAQIVLFCVLTSPFVVAILVAIVFRLRARVVSTEERFSSLEDDVYTMQMEKYDAARKETHVKGEEMPLFSWPQKPERNKWRRK